MSMTMSELANCIKLFKDFPKEGIRFRHIGPLLGNPIAFKFAINEIIKLIGPEIKNIDAVAGLEARGFIFATAISLILSKPQVMIRKPGKIPGPFYTTSYSKEYQTTGNEMVLEHDSIKTGQRVLIVDDLLATGGTMLAGAKLIEQAGGIPYAFATLIELQGLEGISNITKEYPNSITKSLLVYPHDSDTLIPNTLIPDTPFEYTEYTEYRPTVYPFTDNNPVLMWHPSMESFAKGMLNSSNFRASYVDWSYFPDGWPNITFEPSATLVNKDLTFIMSVAKKEIFAEQLALLVALPRQLIKSLNIIIPYLGPATHERVDFSGMLATVEPILKILSSSLQCTKTGPPIIRVFDIHALPIRFYVEDNVVLKLMSAIPVLKKYLNGKRVTIAFPDDGAYKRFKYQFENYPMVICSKVRIGEERIISIKDMYNWPEDQEQLDEVYNHVIIIDDLAQSGSTLKSCAIALKKLNFKKVSAYVTHSIFPNNAWKQFTTDDVFDEFITTNTNPEVSDILQGIKPFVILDIHPHLIEQLDVCDKCVYLNPKKVFVTSTNVDKMKAVYKMFKNNETTFYSMSNISSGVNEQPIGLEETSRGCNNRLNLAKQLITENDIVVSIENGLERIDFSQDYEDICVVSIHKDNTTYVQGSTGVAIIPKKYHKYVEQSINDPSKTFGSIIERALGLKSGTWFESILDNKTTRLEIIYNTLSKFGFRNFNQMFKN